MIKIVHLLGLLTVFHLINNRQCFDPRPKYRHRIYNQMDKLFSHLNRKMQPLNCKGKPVRIYIHTPSQLSDFIKKMSKAQST